MKRRTLFSRPFAYAVLYGAVLFLFTLYSVLDTFVIVRRYSVVEVPDKTAADGESSGTDNTPDAPDTAEPSDSPAAEDDEPVITDNSYSDQNITITITEYREHDTTIYVADITVKDTSYLKAAFAEDIYGRNVKQKTSVIAGEHDAILAINGDFYGSQTKGYVLRNGIVYRSAAYGSSKEDLVIYSDGSFEVVTEGSASLDTLKENGAWQVYSFGPGLVENGDISVSENEEVDKAMAENPRTAIGMISPLHYVMVVSDGRTDESSGLTLYQLAEFMRGIGVTCAYNLDGGGSSAMYFNGELVNNPTTNGKINERSVSDIVYIGC